MSIPKTVTKYFYGDDLSELNFEVHRKYMIEILLEHGDKPAIQWLFSKVTREEILTLLPSLKLSKKSANFWRIYLS